MLIGDLVAVAIAGVTNQSIQDWIQSGGPNLYWALASLPTPLVDMREALQQEMNLPVQVFPFLKDPENASYTPDQWRQTIGESVQRLSELGGRPSKQPSDILAQTAATGLILAGYPAAKQELIKSGMDPTKVRRDAGRSSRGDPIGACVPEGLSRVDEMDASSLLAVVPADARVP